MDGFPDAIDATPDPTLVVDGDGVVRAGTPSVEAVFGLDLEDLSGRSVSEVFEDSAELDRDGAASIATLDADPGDDDPETAGESAGDEGSRDASEDAVAALVDAVRAGESRSLVDGFELVVRRGDGVPVPVRVSVGGFEIDGNPYAVVTAIDVSNERTRQLALRRRTETLESLHEATRELLKTTDREAAAEAAVSYVDDVLGHPIAAIWFYDEQRDALEPAVWTDTADAVSATTRRSTPTGGASPGRCSRAASRPTCRTSTTTQTATATRRRSAASWSSRSAGTGC
jgi:PAS domain-containing protein